MSDEVRSGVVKWFDVRKGWGFITDTNFPDDDIMVHYNVVPGKAGEKNLTEGDKVTYMLGEKEDGRLFAKQVLTIVRS